MLRVGIIIGSTRANRFADIPARWTAEWAARRGDIDLEILDLRDQNLPFLDEPMPPSANGGMFSRPEAKAWGSRLATLDAFIATVAEYNHGPTAVLKNAFDSAYNEWGRKPIAFVGYGGVGGARAIQQLRATVIGLERVSVKQGVTSRWMPFSPRAMAARSMTFPIWCKHELRCSTTWCGGDWR